MKKTNLILCIILIAISGLYAKPQAPLTLITENYPPLTFAVGDSITGYGAEVVNAIQSILKTKYIPVIMNWNEAYERALIEPNIVIFTMEKTPERAGLFQWVGPLGENTTYFYVRKDSPLKIKSLDDAKTARYIGTVSAWFSEQYLKKQGFPNLMSSEKPVDSVKKLMDGDVDMGVFTDLTVNQIVKDAGYEPSDIKPIFEIMTTNYYIGFSKLTNPAVVLKWQKALVQLQNDGTLDKLRAKWLLPE